ETISVRVGTENSGVPMKMMRMALLSSSLSLAGEGGAQRRMKGWRRLRQTPHPPFGHPLEQGEKDRMPGLTGSALGGLVEFLDDAVALETAEIVDIHHAIEVIEFVLDTDSELAFSLADDFVAIKIGIFHRDLVG